MAIYPYLFGHNAGTNVAYNNANQKRVGYSAHSFEIGKGSFYIESVFIRFSQAKSLNIRAVIYEVESLANRQPGALVAYSQQYTSIPNGYKEFFMDITVPVKQYYIGAIANLDLYYANESSGIYDDPYNNDTYSDGPSDPFGSRSYFIGQWLNCYVTGEYIPPKPLASCQIIT